MKISVLTPSFNYAQFIGEAIASVRGQGYDDYEHIIQDANSWDDTSDVVQSFQDGHVRLFEENDSGQSDALNRALARANGEWVAWLNADEYYLPDAFARFLAATLKYPDIDVFFADCLLVDENSQPLRLLPGHRMSSFVLRNDSCFISSCATFVRRAALEETGWDVRFRRGMDWDLWLSFDPHRMRYLPFTSSAFRVHANQVTQSSFDGAAEERLLLERKHRLQPSWWRRRGARAWHLALKAQSGSFVRQLRTQKHIKSAKVRT